MSKVGVCVIVKNEAKNIRAAVESFRPVADEIVVYDTGSTDGTQDILDGLMIIEVQLAIVRPAEFIQLRFIQQMQKS